MTVLQSHQARYLALVAVEGVAHGDRRTLQVARVEGKFVRPFSFDCSVPLIGIFYTVYLHVHLYM